MLLKIEEYKTHWYNKVLCYIGIHHWDYLGKVPIFGSDIEDTNLWECRHCRLKTIIEPGKPV